MWSPFVIDHLFSHGTLVSTTNKTDRHDVIEIFVESGIKHHNPNLYVVTFWWLTAWLYNKTCFSDHLY